MVVIRRILVILISLGGCSIQGTAQEWTDFLDADQVVHPDWLFETWFRSLDTLSTPTPRSPAVWSQSYRMQHLMSLTYTGDTSWQLLRYRGVVSSPQLKFSTLAQPGFMTAGLEIKPDHCPFIFFIGDLQYDFGLGLTFSNRYYFDSWTADPVQRIYRPAGLRCNSSSDPARVMRGGGLMALAGPIQVNGFFSEAIQGLTIEYHSPNLASGFTWVDVSENGQKSNRLGWYNKVKVPVGILFNEFSLQTNHAWALESGWCFFKSENHRFIAIFRYWSPQFLPNHNKLSYSRPKTHDRVEKTISYQARLSHGWVFQSELLSLNSHLLEDGMEAPKENLTIRCGLRYEKREHGFCFIRMGYKPDELKGLVRFRYLMAPGQYFQFETGVAKGLIRSESGPGNGYLAFDWKYIHPKERLDIAMGCLLHQASPGAPLLYRYEANLLYNMSIPVISGHGKIAYLKVRYRLGKSWMIESKIRRLIRIKKAQKETPFTFQLQFIFRPSFVVQSS